jgi:hypothetical protein
VRKLALLKPSEVDTRHSAAPDFAKNSVPSNLRILGKGLVEKSVDQGTRKPPARCEIGRVLLGKLRETQDVGLKPVFDASREEPLVALILRNIEKLAEELIGFPCIEQVRRVYATHVISRHETSSITV